MYTTDLHTNNLKLFVWISRICLICPLCTKNQPYLRRRNERSGLFSKQRRHRARVYRQVTKLCEKSNFLYSQTFAFYNKENLFFQQSQLSHFTKKKIPWQFNVQRSLDGKEHPSDVMPCKQKATRALDTLIAHSRIGLPKMTQNLKIPAIM